MIRKKNQRKKVYQLFNDGRINFYAPADYSRNGALYKYIKSVIDIISMGEKIKTEQKLLNLHAEAYKIYTSMRSLIDNAPPEISKKDRQKFEQSIEDMKEMIEGNID